jgi:peptidoglycan/LPS O-acetylase OafA/YrhL
MSDSVLLAQPEPKRAAVLPSPVTNAVAEAPRPVGLGVRFDHLDGIRALAAAYVVLDHHVFDMWKSLTPRGQTFAWLFQFGHYSVDIFIVLSGYCLMLPIARSRSSSLRTGLAEYISRRALRILPPYFAAVLLSVVVLWTLGRLADVPVGSLVLHLLLLHNFSRDWVYSINSPLWSVAVEWQIYFIFPLLLLPIRRRFGGLICIAAALVMGLAPHILLTGWNRLAPYWPGTAHHTLPEGWNLDWSYPWLVGLFAMGMAAAAASYRRLDAGENTRRKSYAIACIALFAIVAFSTWQNGYMFKHIYIEDILLGISAAFGLAWAGRHCMNTETRRPLVIRVLSARPLVWIGMFSYSLYLIHVPVWLAIAPAVQQMHLHPAFELVFRFCIGLPIAIGCSYLFFVLVERPAMTMRSRSPRLPEKELDAARRPLNIFVHRASECLTDYFPNGDGLICFSILGELARRGHRVFAYTNRDEVRDRPTNLKILARHHRIPANSLADHEHAWRAAQWLREIERSQPIDLVWRMQPLGESCPTVPFTNGHPLVLGPTFHPWPSESVAPNEAGKPRFGFGIRDTVISPIAKRGWANALRSASLVMCTTDVLADQTRHKTLGKVTTVPVIVDAPAELAVKPRPILAGSLKLLFVANLYRNKNPLIFCQTIHRLRQLGVDATGEILGDGPERGAMEDWCNLNGVANVVRFCGRIPNAQVYERLADADGLVSTSLGEPYGRGIAEAMSVGAVPICHCSGGPSDFIRHGIGGVLVETLQGDDYANAIYKVWNEPGAWQRISTAAVEQSLQWRTKAVIDRVEDSLYALMAEETGI